MQCKRFAVSVDPNYPVYERDQIKYEKLSQDPHDNEEEDDDVVFAQNGVVSNGTNGNANHSTAGDINGVQLERAKILRKGTEVEVKVKKLKTVTKYRALCICCIFLVIIAVILGWLLLLPVFSSGEQTTVMQYHNSTPDWTLLFGDTSEGCRIFSVMLDVFFLQLSSVLFVSYDICDLVLLTVSESCVRLYDIDQDGRDDIILGMVDTQRQIDAMDIDRDTMGAFCRSHSKHLASVFLVCSYICLGLTYYDALQCYKVS